MLCSEVINVIERKYPGRYALGWDNTGLLAGRDDKQVTCIYIALDAEDETVREAVRCHADMLITHHPLIFGGLKRITNQDFIGRRILELIRHDISYYAMHTNYDVAGMGKLAAGMMGLKRQEVLEVTCEEAESAVSAKEDLPASGRAGGDKEAGIRQEGIGRIGRLESPVTLRQCCEDVKRVFDLASVRVFGDLESKVERIAICPGSGKSVVQEAVRKRSDVLITGDIGHHEGIDAAAQGMAVIDAGHYGIEYIFIEDMRRYLAENLGGQESVKIVTAPVRHPFVNV